MLLSEATALFLEQRRIEGNSPHTLASYKYLFSKIVAFVGDMPLEEVTINHLRGYLSSLEHRKNSTLAMRIRLMRVFFRWANEEGYAPTNAARKLKEPKLGQRIPKALSVEELETIRDACKTKREHALIEFLFASGCRAGELSGIRKNDLDWDRKAAVVLGKGDKQREVYWGAKASIWMKRYLATRGDECEFLFVTERGPARRLTPHELWYIVKGIAERVGMRSKVWPHVLRHSLATTLLNQGAPLVAVQSILGHSDPKTTEVYAQLSGASRQQAYNRYFIQ